MASSSGFYFYVLFCIGIYHSNLVQSTSKVRVSSVKDAPFLIEREVRNSTFFAGYVRDLLDALEENTGLEFHLREVKDLSYGSQDTSGSWNGMIGELLRNETDVALLLTETRNRYDFIDFSHPVISVGLSIVMSKPKVVFTWQERMSRLLVPVEISVWLVIVLAFFVTSTVLFIVCSVNPNEWRAMGKRGEASVREVETFTCIHTFWFIVSTLFWQGYVRAPRSTGGRLVTTGWFFFVLIAILAYTASLINYLQIGPEPSVAKGYSRINSFEDLAKSEDIVVGMLSTGLTFQQFESAADDSVEGRIFKKAEQFMAENKILNHMQGIKLLTERPDQDKSFAYIMESTSAEYLVSHRCDLHVVATLVSPRYLALGVRKHSTLLQPINSGLLAMQERGQIVAIEEKWFRESLCPDSHRDKDLFSLPLFYPLELETLSGAILVLAIGIVAGCLFTALEVCVYRQTREKPVQ